MALNHAAQKGRLFGVFLAALLLSPTVAAEFQYQFADPPPLDEVVNNRSEQRETETSSFEDQVRDMRVWLRQRDAERRQDGGPLDLSLPEEFTRPDGGAVTLHSPTDPFQTSPPDESGYRTWGNTHVKLRNHDGGGSRISSHRSSDRAGKHSKEDKRSASKISKKADKETSTAKPSKSVERTKKGSD